MPAAADTRALSSVLETDTAVLRIPTRLEWVGKAAEFLCHRACLCGVCDQQRGDNLLLVLHEALTNAIVHGNLGVSSKLKELSGDAFARALAERSVDPRFADREVTVSFNYDGERCEIRITDEGDGFDWETVLSDADAQANSDMPSMAPSGRGLIIMRAFVDDLRYHRGGREAVLTLRSTSPHERRVAPRSAWSQAVRVAPLDGAGEPDWQSAWTAMSRDLSRTGLALMQSHGHTARRVLIELDDGGRTVYVPAEVCRVTQLDGGLVHLGCRFGETTLGAAADPRDPASDAAVCQVLDRIEQQSDSLHRRAHPRLNYTAQIQVRAADGRNARPAFSRDLSRGGMAFVSAFDVPLGEVELLLPVPGTTTDSSIRAHVVRCQRVTAGVFDVGCRFI